MKLKTKFQDEDFELGEVVTADIATMPDGRIKLQAVAKKGGHHTIFYDTLEKLNEEWEDYEGPLIKDEKIRKAIKMWAVTNGCDRVSVCNTFSAWGVRYDFDEDEPMGGSTDILFRGEPPLEPGEQYSIEDLCGGEE